MITLIQTSKLIDMSISFSHLIKILAHLLHVVWHICLNQIIQRNQDAFLNAPLCCVWCIVHDNVWIGICVELHVQLLSTVITCSCLEGELDVGQIFHILCKVVCLEVFYVWHVGTEHCELKRLLTDWICTYFCKLRCTAVFCCKYRCGRDYHCCCAEHCCCLCELSHLKFLPFDFSSFLSYLPPHICHLSGMFLKSAFLLLFTF